MTIQDLGSVGELVAAIATVATLGYLAVQVRQNTRALRANAFKDFILANADSTELLRSDRSMAETWQQGLSDREALDQADRFRFDSFLARYVANLEIAQEFSRLGLLEDSILDVRTKIVAGILGSRGGNAWWRLAEGSYHQPVRDLINRALAESEQGPAA